MPRAISKSSRGALIMLNKSIKKLEELKSWFFSKLFNKGKIKALEEEVAVLTKEYERAKYNEKQREQYHKRKKKDWKKTVHYDTKVKTLTEEEKIKRRKAQIKAYQKEYYSRPEVKERRRKYYNRPEVKERVREQQRRYQERLKAQWKKRERSIAKLDKKLVKQNNQLDKRINKGARTNYTSKLEQYKKANNQEWIRAEIKFTKWGIPFVFKSKKD